MVETKKQQVMMINNAVLDGSSTVSYYKWVDLDGMVSGWDEIQSSLCC